VSRVPSVDDAGRPIVAELGRAETPEETAERKALARETRRSNQNTRNLVLALLASLGVVALIVLVVVRPQSIERDPVDYAAVAADAQPGFDIPLVVPVLPEGWSANRAESVDAGADGVQNWQIGLLTPGQQYIELTQGVDANDTWVSLQTHQADATDSFLIDGVGWSEYDRRDVQDPGNDAYILVATVDRSTVVLAGTAGDEEFQVLAEAVAASVTEGVDP
jgi:hypothetical protein